MPINRFTIVVKLTKIASRRSSPPWGRNGPRSPALRLFQVCRAIPAGMSSRPKINALGKDQEKNDADVVVPASPSIKAGA
jgi:hypothetical protein